MRSWKPWLTLKARSNRGETLIESIVSLLILTMLLTAVGSMVQSAMTMTRMYTAEAKEMQEGIIRDVVLGAYEGTDATVTFTLTLKDADPLDPLDVLLDLPIKAEQPVYVNSDTILAFSPKSGGSN